MCAWQLGPVYKEGEFHPSMWVNPNCRAKDSPACPGLRVESYPDFEKLAHLIQHGLQGFMVKNIEGESMDANDLSHVL